MATPLSRDTSPDVEQRQIEAWREMSVAEKAALITGLSAAARAMALAGIRHRFPAASPREHFLRLAIVTLGLELARSAYPEIDFLDPA
jgi:hypothetical protein